ncbi:hypothetical protein D3C85_1337870 [compost metagenome]
MSQADYQVRLEALRCAQLKADDPKRNEKKCPPPQNEAPGNDTLRSLLAQQLSTAYKRTVPVRTQMSLLYEQITKNLNNPLCHTPNVSTAAVSTSHLVTNSDAMQQHVAVQHYGNWPAKPDDQQAM